MENITYIPMDPIELPKQEPAKPQKKSVSAKKSSFLIGFILVLAIVFIMSMVYGAVSYKKSQSDTNSKQIADVAENSPSPVSSPAPQTPEPSATPVSAPEKATPKPTTQPVQKPSSTPSSVPSPTPSLPPSPTPVPNWSVSGRVVDELDDMPLQNISVRIIQRDKYVENGTEGWRGLTDALGVFSVYNVPSGEYKVELVNQTYTIGAIDLHVENTVNTLTLKAYPTHPQSGQLTVTLYEDANGNGSKDSGERPISGWLDLWRLDDGKSTKIADLFVTESGSYSMSLGAPSQYALQAYQSSLYTNPTRTEILNSRGDGHVFSLSFGYIPKYSLREMRVFVFDDVNANGIRETNENFIHYATASVTNASTQQNRKYAVPPDGMDVGPLDFGTYTIELVPENESWLYWYAVTTGAQTVQVTSSSDDQTVYFGAKKRE